MHKFFRELFRFIRFTMIALGCVLWINTWGFWPMLIVLGGANLFGMLLERVEEKKVLYAIMVTIALLLIGIFYLGAPVAAWISWGPVQGVVFFIVTVAGYTYMYLDQMAEKKAKNEVPG